MPDKSDKEQIVMITERLLESGLSEAESTEIESQLGERLRQELLGASKELCEMPEWCAADLGPIELARKFINFQMTAILNEICDSKKKCLKQKYASFVAPTKKKAASIAAMAAAIWKVLGISAPEVAVPAVAVYVALWLFHANLQELCKRHCLSRQEQDGEDPTMSG